jgi:hypothetical protein
MYDHNAAKIRKSHHQIESCIEGVNIARKSRNREQIRGAVESLKDEIQGLKISVRLTRRSLNACKTLGRSILRLEYFAEKHAERFDRADLDSMRSAAGFVRQKGAHVRKDSRNLMTEFQPVRQKLMMLRQKNEELQKNNQPFHRPER